ncbi:MAG TPA: dihydrolipoamide acetyltransferase family protein [Gaiella sp.]|jgi:pyruvate dehydrogenase E2 component (dihydrolipoamide acetyltransferase)
MATEVKLPRLGQGMESGTIVRWLKQEGEAVRKREPLYELDTDKVTQEVEADVEGVLLKIVVAEGEVDVGTTIAVIGKEGETVSLEAVTAKAPAAAEREEAGEEQEPPSEGGVAVAAAEAAPAETGGAEAARAEVARTVDGRVKASPLARRIARERGVDLATVTPTGPEGRIVAEDVEQAAAAPQPAAAPVVTAPVEAEIVQLTSVRKTIARRLTEAWTAPVFQLGASAEMTEALALRERLVERLGEGDEKPTVNDLIVKLAAVALVRHPAVNAVFTGEEIHRFPTANVGIAVAAPTGLVVPVIRSAERLTVQEIARARADVVGRARDGKLTLQDFEDGTFTISNLGMYGVEQFVAVLNPPQVAILAVGAVKHEAVVVEGEIDIAPIVHLTLSCDHRAIDGADGAEFLRTVVELLEAPALAL